VEIMDGKGEVLDKNILIGWYSNRTRGVRKRRTTIGGDQKSGEEVREARAPMHWRRK